MAKPYVDWGKSALSALKRFGESLAQRAETDPRLARAVEQGYDLRNPTLHGTDKVLPAHEGLRPIYSTPEPGQALNYTGGGRRAGPGSPGKGGVTYPLVTKGQVLRAPFEVTDVMPYGPGHLKWLEKLGIKDPDDFFKAVREANLKSSEEWLSAYENIHPDSSWAMTGIAKDIPEKYYGKRFHEMVENPAFRDELVKRGTDILDFAHPYASNYISNKGRVMSAPGAEALDGTARFIMNPSVVRSPFANFEEEGVGLMKAKGGLVRMKECNCG